MSRVALLSLALLGCRPGDTDESDTTHSDCRPQRTPIEVDVRAVARGSVTGPAGQSVYTPHLAWKDLDQDGFTDVVFIRLASEEPRAFEVDWARGPFDDDQMAQILIEPRLDPVRSPAVNIQAADFDGDKVLDVLVTYVEGDGPWIYEESHPPRRGSAWFKGPFPEGESRNFEDDAFQKAAAEWASFGDFDQNGVPDVLIGVSYQDPRWFWFDDLVGPPVERAATTIFDLSTDYVGAIRWNPDDPERPVQLSRPYYGPINWVTESVLVEQPDFSAGGTLVSQHLLSNDGLPISRWELDDLDGDSTKDHIDYPSHSQMFAGTISLSATDDEIAFDFLPDVDVLYNTGDLTGDQVPDLLVYSVVDRRDDNDAAIFESWILEGPIVNRDYQPEDALFHFGSSHVSPNPLGDIDGDGLGEILFQADGMRILHGAELVGLLDCDD